MNNQQANNQGELKGYDTPGRDTVIESGSPVVPSPSVPSEQRLDAPAPVIRSIGETPGDANPALAETVGAEQGQQSTADMLMARETAEENRLRSAGAAAYQDQGADSRPAEFEEQDAGRPTWPDDRRESPGEYMESPRAEAPLLAGNPDVYGPSQKGRIDAVADRTGTAGSQGEARSGLPPAGFDAEEDNYETREMHKPSEPSDLDRIAPEMRNIPDEE